LHGRFGLSEAAALPSLPAHRPRPGPLADPLADPDGGRVREEAGVA
jgi:hypothetical protein